MNWTPVARMPGSLAALRGAAAMHIVGSLFVLGAAITRKELATLLDETLGIAEGADEAAISDHISGTVAQPVEIPEFLEEALAAATIAAEDVSLARHIGVDPLRLLIAGHDSIAKVESDRMALRAVPKWKDRRLVSVDMAFTFPGGVTWRGGLLRCERTRLPETVADSLMGRTLDGIVDHGWEGWKRLRAESASQSGTTLTVRTAEREAVPLLSLGAGAEGL